MLSGTAAETQFRTLARHGWLHFYQMRHLEKQSWMPRVIVRAEGIYLWDATGRRFIDGLSGSYCVNVGYGRTEILRRAFEAASKIHYVSPFLAANPFAVELAEYLSVLAQPVVGEGARVFFVNSGSEGIETAMKLARAYHRRRGQSERRGFLSRNLAYHGTTLGAVAVSGFDPMRADFVPLDETCRRVPHTLCARCELSLQPATCGLACARDLTERLQGPNPAPAGVILEPMQNCGGNIPPPPGYLEAVASACRETGTLLIMDEVICGFGRLGSWFGTARYGATADILVCAKGLTSGYESLGAVIVSKTVADVFLGEHEADGFSHGATFGGRPGAAAAALENLRILRDEALLDGARTQGERLLCLLRQALAPLPCVGDIRGDGLLIGIDLVDPTTREPISDEQTLDRLSEALFNRGVICRLFCTRLDPVLELAPPLIITDAQCQELTGMIEAELRKLATR